jgi:mRNA interferase MazF
VGPHRHVVLAFITSQVSASVLDTDVVLQPTDSDFAATGLRVASAIRLHRLMTASTRSIRRGLGTLSAGTQQRVDEGRQRLFGLA